LYGICIKDNSPASKDVHFTDGASKLQEMKPLAQVSNSAGAGDSKLLYSAGKASMQSKLSVLFVDGISLQEFILVGRR
jgi:hypothetical protein